MRLRASPLLWFVLPAGTGAACSRSRPDALRAEGELRALGPRRARQRERSRRALELSRHPGRAVSSGRRCASPSPMPCARLPAAWCWAPRLRSRSTSEFYARGFFRAAMMIPMVITPSVIGIFWKLLYEQESGVFNAVLHALGLPRRSLARPRHGVALHGDHGCLADDTVLHARHPRRPQCDRPSLIEAGRVDGTTRWQSFRYILLPELVPYMLSPRRSGRSRRWATSTRSGCSPRAARALARRRSRSTPTRQASPPSTSAAPRRSRGSSSSSCSW